MLTYASLTDIGNRSHNEDCLKISSFSNIQCFTVCDGLGGHGSGDIAAQTVCDVFANNLPRCENIPDFLSNTFSAAQNSILSLQAEHKHMKDMKTTAVCMITDGTYAYVGHVGDSRFYGFKKDGAFIRTTDHSVVQLLVNSDIIEETQIRNHPNRNMLLKALGDACEEPICEISEPLRLCDFSAFLLCSDGFWEKITESEMVYTLNSCRSPNEWLDKARSFMTSAKPDDNYSAIIIYV